MQLTDLTTTAMTKAEVADAVYQGMMRYQITKGAVAASFLVVVLVIYGCAYAIGKMREEMKDE